MASSSTTLLFVCFASPPSSVRSVDTNEEICLKRKLWSGVSRRANEARIGCTLSAEFGKRSSAIQFTGDPSLSYSQIDARLFKSLISRIVIDQYTFIKRRAVSKCDSFTNIYAQFAIVGGKILSHNAPSRAKHKVDLGCRDNSALIYSGYDYPNWRCINGCCTRINIVIYGYWTGPDIEDGWGYTEAFVDLSF